jgi:uncharacterized cupredoxin-like copper-binding protein/Cu/Ag efflux protein CusF
MKLKQFKYLPLLIFMLASANVSATGNHAGSHGISDSIGKLGDAAAVDHTINISMNDNMRFYPAAIQVKSGETIKFVVSNKGKLKHEMVLGSARELKEHAALMQKFPEMEHAGVNMTSVAPGAVGEMVWQFTKVGTVNFACLQPGHMQAGMVGKVRVAAGTLPAAKKLVSSQPDSGPVLRIADNPVPAATVVAPASASKGDMVEGEVKKVDVDTKKITLKHGDIKNLDMPGMTMVFQVKDPAMLEKVRAGDKVKFNVEKIGGAFVVTEIEIR